MTFMRHPLLLGISTNPIAQIHRPPRRKRPPEDYHCQRDEHTERGQGPLRVHAEPGDGVGFEGCAVPGEGVGFAEGVDDALFEGAGLGWGLVGCLGGSGDEGMWTRLVREGHIGG